MITAAFFDTVRDEHDNTGWYDTAYGGKEVKTTEGNGIEVPISGLTTTEGDPITQAQDGMYPTSYRILYQQSSGIFTVDLIGFEGLCETEDPRDLTCPDWVTTAGGSKSGGKGKRGGKSRRLE